MNLSHSTHKTHTAVDSYIEFVQVVCFKDCQHFFYIMMAMYVVILMALL